MNAADTKIINDSLEPFNAFVNPMGLLMDTKNQKSTGCRVEVKKGRIRVLSCDLKSHLIFSGPVKTDTMPTFVKEFWFWKEGR